MDELFDSGIKLAYQTGLSYIFKNGDEKEATKILRNSVFVHHLRFVYVGQNITEMYHF
jgi:hypothetical protein